MHIWQKREGLEKGTVERMPGRGVQGFRIACCLSERWLADWLAGFCLIIVK